jgi:uncharacterized protein (DUF362 family)
MPKTISRREFLKLAGMAAASLPASKSLNNFDHRILPQTRAPFEKNGTRPETSIRRETAPESEVPVALAAVEDDSDEQALITAVKNAARAATDFAWLSKGDAVLIKPALNSGNPYPATTSPTGVRAMVELLIEKGAGRVIMSDMSGIEHVKLSPEGLKGSTRDLMQASGLAEAALEAGAELHFPEEAGWDAFFEDHPVDDTYWKQGIMMPNIIQDVEHIILMPRCGRHLLLGSSLGMKNAVGYWRTDSRLVYHKHAAAIQEMTTDANTVPCLREKQRLVLTTATRILTTLGPDKGYITTPDPGLVIGSESIVAHDMAALAWLLLNRMAMSEEAIASSRDPYKNQLLVNLLNRFVVLRLGRAGDAFSAESLKRNDILHIWDDRVLNRAYQVLGGIPHIRWINVENSTPQAVIDDLNRMVSK